MATVLKILPLITNHGGTSGWPSTWHNSTNTQIRALDQPLVAYVTPVPMIYSESTLIYKRKLNWMHQHTSKKYFSCTLIGLFKFFCKELGNDSSWKVMEPNLREEDLTGQQYPKRLKMPKIRFWMKFFFWLNTFQDSFGRRIYHIFWAVVGGYDGSVNFLLLCRCLMFFLKQRFLGKTRIPFSF